MNAIVRGWAVIGVLALVVLLVTVARQLARNMGWRSDQ